MKSPEYVFNVTRLYREVLDRGDELPDAEYEELVRRAETSFSRRATTGWFHSSSGSDLIDPLSQGHRGARLGTVESVRGREIRVKIGADLSIRDGLGFIPDGAREAVVFSVLRIRRAGRDVRFAHAGETVGIEVPPEAGARMPPKGAEIRHMSSRFLDLPQPKETGFPLYRIPVDMKVILNGKQELTVDADGFPRFATDLSFERAQARKSFADILSAVFRQSGESAFTPGAISFLNETSMADDELFVPPSRLKKAKNELFEFLDSAFPPRASAGTSDGDGRPSSECPLSRSELESLAHRERLSPAGGPVPFVSSNAGLLRVEDLAVHAGFTWVPLPPIVMDDDPWVGALERLSEEHPARRFAVGLNNPGHLRFASSLAARANIFFFADFFLYVANTRTLAFLQSRVPRLLFCYSWIEGDGPAGVVRPAADFRAPLFTSLGCFARHSLHGGMPQARGGGSCVDDCPKDFTRTIRQGRNRFEVIVRDCVTYLFKAP